MCAEMQDNRVRTVWNVLYFNKIIVFNGIINQQLYLTTVTIECTVRAFIRSKLTFFMDKIVIKDEADVDPGLSIEIQRGAYEGFKGVLRGALSLHVVSAAAASR